MDNRERSEKANDRAARKEEERKGYRNKSSSSSDTDENNRACGSKTTFHRPKSHVKRRSYRRKNSEIDEANAGTSNNANDDDDDRPGAGTSMTSRPQKQIKRRKYHKTSGDGRETNSASVDDNESNDNAGDSDTSSESGDNEECVDNSDDWITTDDEKSVPPLVLRKIKPKPTLSIIKEVTRRQIGQTPHFENKFYGSLHTVERLKYLHSLDEHRGCVNTVQFNSKGNLLVSGSDDLKIIVWNWATGRKCNSYASGHRNNIFHASWLPRDDLSMMVTCANDGQVRLLDLNNGVTKKVASHRGACNKFAIHPDYPHVAISVGDDGKVLSIDVRDGETSRLATVNKRAFAVQLYTIHANPRNCNEFCIGGNFSLVKIYDRRKANTPLLTLCPKKLIDKECVQVTAVTYNHNGTEILASYNDEDIYLFDTLTPDPNDDYAHKYQGHRNSRTRKGVSYFGPKSEFIVSGSDCGNIFFWEKNTEAIVQCIPGDAQGVVNCVKPHPYIPVLASSGLDDDVKIWIPQSSAPRAMTQLEQCVRNNLMERSDDWLSCQSRRDDNLFRLVLSRTEQLFNREFFNILYDNHSDGTFDDDDG